jgi:hypothetical protein
MYCMKKLSILLLFTIVVAAVSCSKKDAAPAGNSTNPTAPVNCDGANAKFAADVHPIIQSNCATSGGCHGAGSNNGPGALESFIQIKNAAASIKSAVVSKRMPRGGSLNAAEIKSISCWVDGGSPDN